MEDVVTATRQTWSKKTYYEVLNVSKDASNADIKKAYYKMARQYHPDQSEDPAAEEIFKIVNEAYHVLIDDQRRAAYDKYGKEGVAQTEGGGVNPIDTLKAMFGGDSFQDTFGDLNIWETMEMQMMMAGGAEMTEEEARARLQKFAEERHAKLVAALLKKLDLFVGNDMAAFKEIMDADVKEKASAPGGVALLGVVGYIYCQMAQQYMDKFLGIGSFFAKVAEKGHRFKNNMSALSAAVKLTYSAVKLQSRMEAEEQEKIRKWMEEHPGEPYPGEVDEHGEPRSGDHTFETYDFEHDEKWKAYERNVEIPEGVDRDAAMLKIRTKWYDANVAAHKKPVDPTKPDEEDDVLNRQRKMEEEMMKDQEMMRVFDQGLRLMWKLGVMEAEEIVREVCREICDAKSPYNEKNPISKEQLKRRVTAIHHIGEKYKSVSAKLKKDEKKGFTVQDFVDGEGKQPPVSPRKAQSDPTPSSTNTNNDSKTPTPAEPPARPPAPAEAPSAAPRKADDVD